MNVQIVREPGGFEREPATGEHRRDLQGEGGG
jgi:hypothetical protein